MKKIVFTICSNNYLAHAATLFAGWFEQHPDTTGYVFLVDEQNDAIDYALVAPAAVVEIKTIGIAALDTLVESFNITELNTAVKPDVFLYLFDKYPGAKIVYLDPDILVTAPFVEVFDALDNNDFVLTPHITQPIDDDKAPTDYHTLRTGIFNLGFVALRDSAQIWEFLLWWRARVYKYGYCELTSNMFYDQLWTNFIPVFYEKYCILKHPGYNMANWNLHERALGKNNAGEWQVNGQEALKFFHFSGYKFTKPDSIGSYHSRYDFETRLDLLPIFAFYQSQLLRHGAAQLSHIPCVYFERHKQLKATRQLAEQTALALNTPLKTKVIRKIASAVRRLIYR